MVKETNDVLS